MAPLRIPQENGEWLNIDDEIERVAGGGGSGGLLVATKPVSAADLLAQPVEIIATPGVGKTIIPVLAQMELVFHTTPYDDSGGTEVQLLVGGITHDTGISAPLLQEQSVIDAFTLVAPSNVPIGGQTDQPMILYTDGPPGGGGDSSLVIYVVYMVADIT